MRIRAVASLIPRPCSFVAWRLLPVLQVTNAQGLGMRLHRCLNNALNPTNQNRALKRTSNCSSWLLPLFAHVCTFVVSRRPNTGLSYYGGYHSAQCSTEATAPVAMDHTHPSEVSNMVLKGMTHKQISEELRSRFPSARGFSERSIRRYCAEHNIHKLKGPDLDVAVRQATEEVRCIIL